jgi:hypothetical protein
MEMDLDIDDISDSDEEDPAQYLALNDDDDNNNDTIDKSDSAVSGEDDMVSLSLSFEPDSMSTGVINLSGSSKVKVWENPTKGTEVTLPKQWDLSSDTVPSNLYVEGVQASSSLKDIELKLSYINGSTICDDKVKITVINVDYTEDTSQTYGYDSYTDSPTIDYFPYKSVKVGDSDTVYADSSMANGVYFTSSNTGNVTVSPSQASSTHQQVTFQGVSEGFAQGLAELYNPAAYDIIAASIGVYSYTQDSYTLAFRVVHEDDDDVQIIQPGQSGSSPTDTCVAPGINGKRDTVEGGDDVPSGEYILVGPNLRCDTTADKTDDQSQNPYTAAALQSYLNSTIYNQAVVTWSVTKLSDKDVNFDLNRDGYLDVSSWTTTEMDVIINTCEDTNYDYNIFIVENPSPACCGCTQKNQTRGFVFSDYCVSCVDNTTAHELGHSTFGLADITGGDTNNLMHGTAPCPEQLRKGQWVDIQAKQ